MTREDILLIKLAEEASEVAHAVSKALRFGLDDKHPKRGNKTNRELIVSEIEDLWAAFEILNDEGSLEMVIMKNIWDKKDKVEKWMKRSKEAGRLTEVTESNDNN